LKPILSQRALAFQAEIDSFNPWGRHGTYWDDEAPGDGWTSKGVTTK
jgi:hypothetical protein